MPSYSRPKGTRTRPTADWFYANQAAGSGALPEVAAMDSQIILFNNANAAQWLFVLGFTDISNFASNAYYFSVEGSLGTFQNNCFPTVCDAPQPIGQVFGNYVATPADYGGLPTQSVFNLSLANISGGPLAVVKPGYSFVVQTAGDQIVSFTYLVLGP